MLQGQSPLKMPSSQTPTLSLATQDFLLFDEQDGALHHQASPSVPSYMLQSKMMTNPPSATLIKLSDANFTSSPVVDDESVSSRGSISPQHLPSIQEKSKSWNIRGAKKYYTPPIDDVDVNLNGDYSWPELFDNDLELTESTATHNRLHGIIGDAYGIPNTFPTLYKSIAHQQLMVAQPNNPITNNDDNNSTDTDVVNSSSANLLDFAEKERKYKSIPVSQTVSPKDVSPRDTFLYYDEIQTQPSLFGEMVDYPSSYPSPQASDIEQYELDTLEANETITTPEMNESDVLEMNESDDSSLSASPLLLSSLSSLSPSNTDSKSVVSNAKKRPLPGSIRAVEEQNENEKQPSLIVTKSPLKSSKSSVAFPLTPAPEICNGGSVTPTNDDDNDDNGDNGDNDDNDNDVDDEDDLFSEKNATTEFNADDSDEYIPGNDYYYTTKLRRVTRASNKNDLLVNEETNNNKRKPPYPRHIGHSTKKYSKKKQEFICTHKMDDGRLCGVTFARPYDRIRHEKTVHEETLAEKWTCDLCPGHRAFSRHDALIRHRRVKHNRRT